MIVAPCWQAAGCAADLHRSTNVLRASVILGRIDLPVGHFFAGQCPAPARKIFIFRFSELCVLMCCLAPVGGALRPIVTKRGREMRWTAGVERAIFARTNIAW